MAEEIDSLLKNETWNLVEVPARAKFFRIDGFIDINRQCVVVRLDTKQDWL